MRESGGGKGRCQRGTTNEMESFFFLIRNRRSTELIPKKIKQNHRQPQQQRQQQQDDKRQNGRRRGNMARRFELKFGLETAAEKMLQSLHLGHSDKNIWNILLAVCGTGLSRLAVCNSTKLSCTKFDIQDHNA